MAIPAAGQPIPSSSSSWQSEIVPMLRHRLETESAFIENRLPTQYASHQPGLPPLLPSDGRGQMPLPLVTSPPAAQIPLSSRIPTRARSRSQSALRQLGESSTSSPDTLPQSSNIPMSSAEPTTMTLQPSHTTGRESPDILPPALRQTESFIKDELPPFKLLPDEAMQIAKRGHAARDMEQEIGWDDDSEGDAWESKRTGAITTRPRGTQSRRDGKSLDTQRSNSSRQDSASSMTSSSGRLPRPTTATTSISEEHRRGGASGSSIGLGQPSSSRQATPASKVQGRSASSRLAQADHSSVAGSRSASLNMLASSTSSAGTPSGSRLGVAAHFVPPDTTYTPPKGVNWDDVVLPTVAKRLGLGQEAKSGTNDEGAEWNLAVEWDKTGTPIRWVKRSVINREPNFRPSTIDPSSGQSGLPTGGVDLNASVSSAHSFSPTFDLSPENPLRPPSILGLKQVSQSSLRPPASRHTSQPNRKSSQVSLRGLATRSNRSGEIELSSIRTTPTSAASFPADGPPSPSPFSSLTPRSMHADQPPSPRRPPSLAPGISRRPSSLRKLPSFTISTPGSQSSLPRQQGLFSNPRPAPHISSSQSLRADMQAARGGVPYDGKAAREDVSSGDQVRGGPPGRDAPRSPDQAEGDKRAGANGQQRRRQGGGRDRDDSVQKGCGCILM